MMKPSLYTHHILVLFLSTTTVVCIQEENDRHEIELFSGTNFSDKGTKLYLTNCSNAPASAINTTFSIQTNGRCVQVYDQLNCIGNTIQIPARGPISHNLAKWGFDNKVQSVGFCGDPCTPEVNHNIPLVNATGNESNTVTFYDKSNFEGDAYTYPISSGCEIIENYIPELSDTFQSVSISKGSCVLLFLAMSYNTKGCFVQNTDSVLELRDGLTDLRRVLDKGEFVKAISPCQCKSRNHVTLPKNPENPVGLTEQQEYIILYSLKHFIGKSLKLSLNVTGCQSMVTKLKDWEKIAQSIYVSKGSCVQVYRDGDCAKANFLTLTEPLGNLNLFNMHYDISSLSRCPIMLARVVNLENANVQDETKSPISTSLYYYFVPLVGVSLLVSAILAGVLVRIKMQSMHVMNTKCKPEKLSDKEIHEFTHGLGLELGDVNVAERERNIENEYESGNVDRPKSLKFSSDLLAQNQPYNFELELSKSVLEFGK
ncbi:unnamed protein product [Orchesella dallaii]|uniref:Calcium-dependent cell adhesion molecule N-terminal domain-containing protein n=1 Tax=Orchesella dallaii TaxID=48710 RepID=A0ABP1R1W5_9HEXA